MVPLGTYQACSHAENLQNSQGRFSAQRARRTKLCMQIGTWNVWSMVDTEGSLEVASQRSDGQGGEDRKVDQIVCELARYDVLVGALQQTKWFGCEVYEVDGSVILTAGRATPTQEESVQRGEGVALVLRGLAVSAWREAVEGVESDVCVSMSADVQRN